jgi:hypothetical protein
MTAVMGYSANQSTGCNPNSLENHPKMPLIGCINKFFQISALTVGITKKGAMANSRATPRPMNS